jgi:hypothetical protein
MFYENKGILVYRRNKLMNRTKRRKHDVKVKGAVRVVCAIRFYKLKQDKRISTTQKIHIDINFLNVEY